MHETKEDIKEFLFNNVLRRFIMKNFAICTFAIILGTCLSINNAFAVYQNNQYVTAVGTHDSLQGQGNNTDPVFGCKYLLILMVVHTDM